MDTYKIISLCFSGASAIGTVIAAFGAVVAIFQIRKHWRDDDTNAVVIPDHHRLSKNRKGCLQFAVMLRIVNSGKVDFTPHKITFIDKCLEEKFKIVSSRTCDYALSQGTYWETWALIIARENDVTFPKEIGIVVISADGKNLCKLVVKPDEFGPAK